MFGLSSPYSMIKMNMLIFLMKRWGVIKSAQYRLCKFCNFIRTITLCLFYIPKLRTLVFWGFRNVISRISCGILTRVHIHYVLLPYVPYWYGRYVRESYVPIIIIYDRINCTSKHQFLSNYCTAHSRFELKEIG